jgi:two-component sensor histidine kinase
MCLKEIAGKKNMLGDLCRANTDLSEEDIEILEGIEKNLSMISKLAGEVVFIDCLTRDADTAIVVAEAKPSNYSALYKNSVIGMLALRKNEPAVLRTLEIGLETTDLKAITQENIMVKQNTVPIKNESGKVIGVLIMEKDITEDVSKSRNMEILSETTEQLAQTLINLKDGEGESTVDYNLINDAIVIFDEWGRSIYANYSAEELYRKLGYKDKIVGMKFDNLVLSETKFLAIVKTGKAEVFETNVGRLCLQAKYAVTKRNNNCTVIMLIKDITDIKQKEKELILKSVAIREIHHRVKNNLQTIASILRLQSRRINSIEAKKSFQESISRVLSIAAVHEVLAQNGIEDIDIKNILAKIKDIAIRTGIQYSKNIKVELLGDSFNVNSDKATSIAIVLNELLENSIKHAFNKVEEGNIQIIIEKGIMYSSISVIDTGSGFDLSLKKNESLGLNIVNSIVKDKLNGNLNIESNEWGTNAIFYFEN